MVLSYIGWIIAGTILSVVVIALIVARIMCPPEFFQPPKEPEPPKPAPPPDGVDDLEEFRPNQWRKHQPRR